MKHVLFSACVVIASLPVAQAQTFSVIACNHADSVVLRWAPHSAAAWEQAKHTGYRVERLKVGETTAERLGPDTLRGWSLEQFRSSFPKDHPNAPAAVQVMHGSPTARSSGPEDMGSAMMASNEESVRWSIGMFLADVDAPIATAMGLRFVDGAVEPGAWYLYRVITCDGAKSDTAMVGVNRKLGPDGVAPGPLPMAEELERRVTLRWERNTVDRDFTAYWIERSADGRAWVRLNARPFVPVRAEGARDNGTCSYTDSSLVNYIPHHYRVRGITPFGEVSAEATGITAMGRDRTAPPAPIMEGAVDERGKLVVRWKEGPGVSDFAGYRVEKALTSGGAYYALHRGLLPKGTSSHVDTSSYLIGENHYRVAALDTAGNVAYSMDGYGSLTDSIAPLPPVELTGSIDTNGVVTVRWARGREQDLFGYRVFFANAVDHAFNNLSPAPIASTVFTDTITLRTLTKQIHYKVVAVDRNFNHSGFSAMLTLEKPDRVAPVAPLIADYMATDSTVVLRFVPSSSTDVASHRLLRKRDGEASFSEVATWKAGRVDPVWIDLNVQGPAYYSYTIVALDSAGNRSPQAQPIEVRVRGLRDLDGPDEVVASIADGRTVQVRWTPVQGKVQHYVVYRIRDGGAPMEIAAPKSDGHTCTDIRVPGNGSYTYAVKVVYEDGKSSRLRTAAPLQVGH